MKNITTAELYMFKKKAQLLSSDLIGHYNKNSNSILVHSIGQINSYFVNRVFTMSATIIATTLIKELSHSKIYLTLPRLILSYLRRDTGVDTYAFKIWMTLFDFTYFDELSEIKISIKSLAQEVNIAETTVKNRLKKLEEKGYLRTIHHAGGTPQTFECNTYQLIFSEELAKHCRAAGDRKKAINHEPVTTLSSPEMPDNQKANDVEHELEVINQERRECLQNHQLDKLYSLIQKERLLRIQHQKLSTGVGRAAPTPLGAARPHINNKTNNKKTTCFVLSDFENKEQRELTEFDFQRLNKGLNGLPDKERLLKEILYSITHEKLSLEKLTISHAINAALKLVKEGRWRTPYGLFNVEVKERERRWESERKLAYALEKGLSKS